VLVDGLAFVVVVRMALAVVAGQDLARLVGLEALVEALVALGALDVAGAAMGQHERVVRHQVLGVDREDVL